MPDHNETEHHAEKRHDPDERIDEPVAPPVLAARALGRGVGRGVGGMKMPYRIALLALVFGLVGGAAGAYGFVRYGTSMIPTSRQQLVVQENSAVIDVAKQVGPAVVSITSKAVSQGFFGMPQQIQAAGTGMIVRSDGLILTNRHVVDDASASYTVVLSNGKSYPAKVVSKDSINDIAFVQIQASGLPTVKLGDSGAVQVGQQVIAVGNALGQFQNTVTSGIISGLSRGVTAGDSGGGGSPFGGQGQTNSENLQDMFQTDAAINPGNSGGPLVNLDGQVIGMNTAVAGEGAQNIGFAIPINDAKSLISSVESTGKISRAYLGVQYVMLDPQTAEANNLPVKSGAWVQGDGQTSAVQPDSPAEKGGVKDGDIITKVGGTTLDSKHTLQTVVGKYKPGDKVTLTVNRGGKTQTLSVTLGTAPSGQ
jgi:serine protease Do